MRERERDLVLFPLGFLGAELGDVVLGFADEAALSGFHARNPERMLSQFGGILVRGSFFAGGGLESLLLGLVLEFLGFGVGVFGWSDLGFGEEFWVLFLESLPS